MSEISTPPKDRSASRGREFHSSGRGGVGNIRRSSISREPSQLRSPLADGPDDFSVTRGREPISIHDTNKVVSLGRGGAGNIRSPSRDISRTRDSRSVDRRPVDERQSEHERDIIRNAADARVVGVHSSGRGGIGNISRSRSRSRSRDPHTLPVRSTGRGGVGNIKPSDLAEVSILDVEDEERAAHHLRQTGIHSTGRGGLANITSGAIPPVEPASPHGPTHAHEFESVGRGGAGNIRSRSASRGPDGRGLSIDRGERHGIAALLQRVARSGSRPREAEVERGRDTEPVREGVQSG